MAAPSGTTFAIVTSELEQVQVDPSLIFEWQVHTDVDAIVRVVTTGQLSERRRRSRTRRFGNRSAPIWRR